MPAEKNLPPAAPTRVHRNLAEQIVAALGAIFGERQPAERVVERTLRAQAKWGSRDRRMFAEGVYDSVRWWRLYWNLGGLPDAEHLDRETLTEARVWRVWGVCWIEAGGTLPYFEEFADFDPAAVRARRDGALAAAIRASIPDWLHYRAESELGAEWASLLDALNRPAEVFLRVNSMRLSRAELRGRLAREEQIESEEVPGLPDALRLRQRRNLATSRAFREGLFEVQDAASQQIAPLLGVRPGGFVIDACAGAGGKTLHLAALMRNQGRIVALDPHASRLDELRSRAQRNGATIIQTRVVAGPEGVAEFVDRADAVLLDVPCSGLGVLRRKPDTKWKLTHDELDRLASVQREILDGYSRLVKPGGALVYATCSILPSENQRQVQGFLARHAEDWAIETERAWRPDREGFDGFYAARLVRKGRPGGEEE